MKKISLFPFVIFLLLAADFYAQKKEKIDSLKKIIEVSSEDTSKVNTLNFLSEELYHSNPDEALPYAREALALSRKIKFESGEALALNAIGVAMEVKDKSDSSAYYISQSLTVYEKLQDKRGMSNCYNGLGTIHKHKGEFDEAIASYRKALSLRLSMKGKNEGGIAAAYNNIGNIFYARGDYDSALNYLATSLEIKERINDKRGAGNSCLTIGNINFKIGNFSKAAEYLLKAITLFSEVGDKVGMAYAYNAYGVMATERKDMKSALEYYSKAVAIFEETGDQTHAAKTYGNIGSIYDKTGEYDKAIEFYLKSKTILEKNKGDESLTIALYNLAMAYLNKGNTKEVQPCLDSVLKYSQQLRYKEGLMDAYQGYAFLYRKTGNYKKAFENHVLYSQMRDSMLNEDNNNKMLELQTQFETAKKDKDLLKKDAELTKEHAASEKTSMQRNIFIGGFGVMIVLAFFIFRSLRINKKKNKIISEQKLAVETQRDLIEKQKHIVEEKQKEILDSIHYAHRIQRALITNEKYFEKNLNRINKSGSPESEVLKK